MARPLLPLQLLALALLAAIQWPAALGLDNGLALTPPMGYNAYMSGVSETGDNLVAMAKFFVSSGLIHSGYTYVNSDEGWEQKQRNQTTGRLMPSSSFGGSDTGIKTLVAEIHGLGLKIGLYGAASAVTCGTMPGQLYHEDLDAQTYATWGIDYRELKLWHESSCTFRGDSRNVCVLQ